MQVAALLDHSSKNLAACARPRDGTVSAELRMPVMQPAIQQVIRALAEDGRVGALGLAEHAVTAYLENATAVGDRALSLDILSRDLASLRGIAPHLATFIGRVETFVAGLSRADLPRAA